MRFSIFFLTYHIEVWERFAQTSLDHSMAVHIDGFNQWINIPNNDTSKPLLLFVGGGSPTKIVLLKSYKNNSSLSSGTSGNQGNASNKYVFCTLTVSKYQENTYELITYLLQRFHRPKLISSGED